MIQNSYNIAPCLSALDAYDGRASVPIHPALHLGVAVADFTRSFATEAFEPRFILGAQAVNAVGDRNVIEIATGTKPVVVESLEVIVENGAFDSFYIGRFQTSVLTAPIAGFRTEIGGIDSTAQIALQLIFAPSLAGMVFLRTKPDTHFSFSRDSRIFLAPGSVLKIISGAPNGLLGVEMIGRELPLLPSTR